MGNQSLDSAGVPNDFWFNTKTGQVEQGKLSAAPYRIGPFATRKEAEQALVKITEHSKRWAAEEENED